MTKTGAMLIQAAKERGVPTKPGHYWAKWKIAASGTLDEENFKPEKHWRIVEVSFVLDSENGHALVTGEDVAQPLENFMWGDGPLPDPEISPWKKINTAIRDGKTPILGRDANGEVAVIWFDRRAAGWMTCANTYFIAIEWCKIPE